jgi:DNA-binding NarL/FixJ family response regulator
MYEAYDLFGILPDNSVKFWASIRGKHHALEQLEILGMQTRNECFATVEDNDVMRKAVVHFLRTDPDIHIVGKARGLKEAVNLAKQFSPDMILLDLHLEGTDSTPPSNVRAAFIGSSLVAMSLTVDNAARQLADDFGAVMLVNKMTLASDLLPSIKQCANGSGASGNAY